MEFVRNVIETFAPFAVWAFWILALAVLVASLIRYRWAKAFVAIIANMPQVDDDDVTPVPRPPKEPRAAHYAPGRIS
jgi:hypothetical protein